MLNIILPKRLHGFTFIELLVALVINLVLFGALLTIFLSNVQQYWYTINVNQLNQQMQTAMMIMSDEIRRAGYWSNASSDLGSGTNHNPFMAAATDIAVGAGNNCIAFTYDAGGTGVLPAITAGSDDDRYGFRLSGNILQERPFGAPFGCSNIASTAWENVTDPNVIQVSALTFTLNTSTITAGVGTLIQRSVDISMTANLTSNSSITKTITQHVRIMNDKFT